LTIKGHGNQHKNEGRGNPPRNYEGLKMNLDSTFERDENRVNRAASLSFQIEREERHEPAMDILFNMLEQSREEDCSERE
jgi:hypothetical protein